MGSTRNMDGNGKNSWPDQMKIAIAKGVDFLGLHSACKQALMGRESIGFVPKDAWFYLF